MCLCPDGDYFKAFSSGKAHIVTDTIKNVVDDGIELSSGQKLDADIIVTATGLNMRLLGGVHMSVDGTQIDPSEQYMWRTSMLTSLPNFGNILGYWNASWTLGSDTASCLFVKLIKHQIDNGYSSVVPVIDDKDRQRTVSASPLNSTYVKNALGRMPKCAERGPWRPRDNWFSDNWAIMTGGLEDGLRWERVAT
jgi:cation diffusion facilitator CzcD-associated flavoprotein CzcO